MANYNLEANFGSRMDLRRRFRLRPLKWGDEDLFAALDPPYDLVLGSDIMYHSANHVILADTIAMLCSPNSRVLWVTPDWASEFNPDSSVAFRDRLTAHGFETKDI